MSDNAEEGIARVQASAARAEGKYGAALSRQQTRGIAYLDDRILIYLLGISMLGLMVLWATAKSAWLLYGSLAAVVLLTLLWGYARIYRIERLRREREREAQNWQSDSGDRGRH